MFFYILFWSRVQCASLLD